MQNLSQIVIDVGDDGTARRISFYAGSMSSPLSEEDIRHNFRKQVDLEVLRSLLHSALRVFPASSHNGVMKYVSCESVV